MKQIYFYSGQTFEHSPKVFAAIVRPVNNKVDLYMEIQRELRTPFTIGNWESIKKVFNDLYWIKQNEIHIYHESITNIQPSWDISTYLSIIHDIVDTHSGDTHNIHFYFNSEEKSNVDKYYPGKSVLEETERQRKQQEISHSVEKQMNRHQLKKELDRNGVNEDSYSLWGDLTSDKIILYHNYSKWEIFYLDERGGRKMMKVCGSESDACIFLYRILVEKKNWWEL